MEQATGYYLNVYGQGYDIFIIFNEGNDEPTIEELSVICDLVEQAVTEGIPDADVLGSFRDKLMTRIESTELPCVEFGVQIIMAL